MQRAPMNIQPTETMMIIVTCSTEISRFCCTIGDLGFVEHFSAKRIRRERDVESC
jgi:hypothetical protein